MSGSHHGGGSSKPLLIGIAAIIVLYLVLVGLGMPQKWTEQANEQHGHAAEGEHHDEAADQGHEHGDAAEEEHDAHAGEAEPGDDHADEDEATEESPVVPVEEAEAADEEHGHEHGDADHETADAAPHAEAGHGDVEMHEPPIWMCLPFALLLLAIALLPLIPATEHWWESNTNRFLVAAVLGLATLAYYLVLHDSPIAGHWPGHKVIEHSADGLNLHLAWVVIENAILNEYIPFIVLLFALFTISGGIRIEGDLRAHTGTNTVIIAIGGLLASFIGTTGAAMLLIRPLLETNRERKYVVHTVIFFIFVVCNCGGCLLPIGDPPLFLGYLKGVPFTWTFALWMEWLFVNGMLLGVYFLWDQFYAYPREELKDVVRDDIETKPLAIKGLWPNALLLLGVVLAVALLAPTIAFPGTTWMPWYYLREIVQIGLVGLSLLLGSEIIRKDNQFNYHAIIEVAALFFGIFICMQAPLQILNARGADLGLESPMAFFWATGSLSAVLDNAPTYVVFFETAGAVTKTNPELAADTVAQTGVNTAMLVAISLGAVFMGAMTYIGNGPNFMVKAIAEQSGVKMPSFFGYMLYSFLVLLPILVITTLIFL